MLREIYYKNFYFISSNFLNNFYLIKYMKIFIKKLNLSEKSSFFSYIYIN